MYQRQLSFGEAVNKVLAQNYCNFSGRASRSEYWWYVLFTVILSFAIGFIFGIFGAVKASQWVGSLVNLALLLPGLGVCVRRLHDIGKSGWWLLIGLIPVVGWIILIVWYCQPSASANEYGPVPDMTD